jgi:alkanesulfonate monooxygenase SsuD/methylene tetrahydromethanopterin reductase-like flavin-dependent oxidoreductase (luciferase family)
VKEATMRYGLYLPNFGACASVRELSELARAAETAGWDGFFLWDHIAFEEPVPFVDPWVALTAMALSTTRLQLGPMVTPLPRRRPWQVARASATLDKLSGGRLVLGVGLGGDWWREYSAFGEPAEDRPHGAMLDEALEVLTGLWSGEPFSFAGQHYQVERAQFLPCPTRQPRIPIWVGGIWPHKAPFRRAARWDGVFPIGSGGGLAPEDVRALLAYIQPLRAAAGQDAPFEVVLRGHAARDAAGMARLADYAGAGTTWWLEGFSHRTTPAELRAAIELGPPR